MFVVTEGVDYAKPRGSVAPYIHSVTLDEYNEVCENNGAIKVMMKRDGRDGVEPLEGVIRDVICKI